MKKIITIAKHEFIFNIKRKEFLLVTFGLPLLIGFISYISGKASAGGFRSLTGKANVVGFVDHCNFLDVSLNKTNLKIIEYETEEKAKNDLLNEEIGSFFVLPPDYFEKGTILHYAVKKNIVSASFTAKEDIEGFLTENLIKKGIADQKIAERIKKPAHPVQISLDKEGNITKTNYFDLILPAAFAIFFIMSIFTSSGFLLQSVSEEKENRIMEILLSSVTVQELLAGKILGLGLLALVQILIWASAGIGILAGLTSILKFLNLITIPWTTIFLAVLYFVLGYLIFAAVMAGTGAIATSQKEAQNFSGFFIFIGVLPFYVIPLIISNPNGIVPRIFSFIPPSAPIVMMVRLSLAEINPLETIATLLVLGLSVIFLIKTAAKFFRLGLLMYGKTPSIKQIVSLLKKA